MDKENIKKLAIEQLSKETNIADYFVRVDLEEEFVDRCILIAQKQVKKLNIDDVSKRLEPNYDNPKNGFVKLRADDCGNEIG